MFNQVFHHIHAETSGVIQYAGSTTVIMSVQIIFNFYRQLRNSWETHIHDTYDFRKKNSWSTDMKSPDSL